MSYLFKAQAEDFCVQERLLVSPEGEGDVLWIQRQKIHLTTMEVIAHLLAHFPLTRKEIGIAGLKDKVGITTQRLTIYRSKLEICGGKEQFLAVLSEKVKILQIQWGKTALKIWGNAGNYFQIRIRNFFSSEDPNNPETIKIKHQLLINTEKVKKNGFPNAFGHQRFGKKMKNFRDAQEQIESLAQNGDGKSWEAVQVNQKKMLGRFSLQAYPSGRFNEYVMRRREKGQMLLEGDLLVDQYHAAGAKVIAYQASSIPVDTRIPTWPMLGTDLLLAAEGTKARVREDQLLTLAKFFQKEKKVCQQLQLKGYRRPLRAKVSEIQSRIQGRDLFWEFSLPTGSYATVALAFLLAGIDDQSLQANNLTIPRINPQKLQKR